MRDFADFLSTKNSQPKMPGAFHFFGRQCYHMLPHRLQKGLNFGFFAPDSAHILQPEMGSEETLGWVLPGVPWRVLKMTYKTIRMHVESFFVSPILGTFI